MLEQNVVTSPTRDGRWLCVLQPWILTGINNCLGNCWLETSHKILKIQKLCLQKLVKVGCYMKNTQVSLSFGHFKDILKSILWATSFRFSALFYVYLERCFIIFLAYSGILSGQVVKYIKMKAPSFDHQRPSFYFAHQRWVSGFVPPPKSWCVFCLWRILGFTLYIGRLQQYQVRHC